MSDGWRGPLLSLPARRCIGSAPSAVTNVLRTLFQAGLPLVPGGIFLVKNRDPFAAAVMLWWSAVAVLDIAPYVYDAQQPQHVLLTGLERRIESLYHPS